MNDVFSILVHKNLVEEWINQWGKTAVVLGVKRSVNSNKCRKRTMKIESLSES